MLSGSKAPGVSADAGETFHLLTKSVFNARRYILSKEEIYRRRVPRSICLSFEAWHFINFN